MLAFGFFSLAVWFFYLVLMLGAPAPVARNLERIAPGYVPQFSILAVLVALALAAAWFYLIFFTERAPTCSLARWAAGIVLFWGTCGDAADALGRLPEDLPLGGARAAREDPARLELHRAEGLGVSQASAFDYHASIRARAFDPLRPDACRVLIVQGTATEDIDDPPSARWRKLAEVGRPGDRVERYRLYHRTNEHHRRRPSARPGRTSRTTPRAGARCSCATCSPATSRARCSSSPRRPACASTIRASAWAR